MRTVMFKGSPVALAGELPSVGSKAPDFILTNASLEDVSWETLRGPVTILSVVPSLDTGVCAASARRLNRELASYAEIQLLKVSMDLPFAQKRFCDTERLDRVVTLSAFRSPDFGSRYGVRIENGPLKGLLARAVFVVDERGLLQHVQLVPEITQEPDYDAVLKTLRTLIKG